MLLLGNGYSEASSQAGGALWVDVGVAIDRIRAARLRRESVGDDGE